MTESHKVNRKLFIVLFILGFVSTILVLPYVGDLLGDFLKKADIAAKNMPLLLIVVIQNSILLVIAVFTGLKLYKGIGFKLPILENLVYNKQINVDWNHFIKISIGTGLLIGLTIVIGDYIFSLIGSPLSFFQTELPVWWKGLMAAIYGGINEEIIYRFGLTTFIAWLLYKLKVSKKIAIWSAIIFVAILFGLSHLPTTAALTPITTIIFLRAIILNSIGAVVFGYLYWKIGLEAAFLSHFTTDVVLHVIMPLII